jgi:hypothetical protein
MWISTYGRLLVLSIAFLAAVGASGRNTLAKRLVVPPQQVITAQAEAGPFPGGREGILIAEGFPARRLVLLDPNSKAIIWQSGVFPEVGCVATLPGGGFVICEGKRIARLDKDGRVISRSSPRFDHASDVRPLENGRMLVSDGPGHAVVEMDWSENIVWSVTGLHWPFQALRLENGDTLIADGTYELKEFNPDAKLVSVTKLRCWAASVQKVDGNNTVVGEMTGVDLLDAAGHAIWSRRISLVDAVQQLPNGEYLVCEALAKRISILDGAGNTTWEVTLSDYPWKAVYVP